VFYALIAAAQCALNSSKAQLRFALLFTNCVLLLRRNMFKVARPPMGSARYRSSQISDGMPSNEKEFLLCILRKNPNRAGKNNFL
jgi:hypothetical protein